MRTGNRRMVTWWRWRGDISEPKSGSRASGGRAHDFKNLVTHLGVSSLEANV